MADDIVEIWEVGLILKFREAGDVTPDQAEALIVDHGEMFRESYGGVRHMIKRGYTRYPPKVIRKIKKEFNGRNGESLRRRYGMSRTHFYRTIKK